jgi:hypothetical protein
MGLSYLGGRCREGLWVLGRETWVLMRDTESTAVVDFYCASCSIDLSLASCLSNILLRLLPIRL